MSQHHNHNPNRKYEKRGKNWVRVRIPMKAAIECVIVDLTEGKRVYWDTETKRAFPSEEYTVFPSRQKARKVLWHILQDKDTAKGHIYQVRDYDYPF